MGRARRHGGARSSPSSASSTTCGRGVISCASPRTACSRCARPPIGAHPGGLYPGDLPVDGYGEDYEFWVEARAASRGDDYDEWIRHWVLEVDDQDEYLRRARRRARGRSCGPRPSPTRGRPTRCGTRPTWTAHPNRWEVAACVGRAPPRRAGAGAGRARGARRAPASRTWPRGSRSRRRVSRGATCSSRPRSACGATTRSPPIRSC